MMRVAGKERMILKKKEKKVYFADEKKELKVRDMQ